MSSITSESGLAEIVALADLISRTVQDVVAEYTAAGVSLPSLSSTSPGPFDTPESMPPNLSKAVRLLDAACAQLSFSVGTPGHVVTNVRNSQITSHPLDILSTEMLWGMVSFISQISGTIQPKPAVPGARVYARRDGC